MYSITIAIGGMAMYLPGTPGEIIGDLRTKAGLSKAELSKRTGIVSSQLSRIENGDTTHISSDILIKLAKEFNVSVDYILGLTIISIPRNYDISQLGLSENTVKALISKRIDVDILNQILEHKTFPYLLTMIKSYFDNSISYGVMARNELINFPTSTLADFSKENYERKKEIKEDIMFLKSQKLGEHEAELEKIKNTFVAILRDIQKNIENDTESPEPITSEQLKQIKSDLANKPTHDISADDVAGAVTNMLGQAMPMDNEAAKLVQQYMSNMLSMFADNIENSDRH